MKVLLATAALLAAWTHGHEIEKRQASEPERRVVCYYTNWSVYRRGLAKYTPQNINPYLCTHLVYAFGGLTDEFEVKPFDTYQDIEQGGYAKFNGLKQYNKGLKTLLAIGGWNEGSGRFSELVSLPEYRKTFIISAIRHLRRYNFDGLDLDWEYPASRDGSAPEDRENYAALVKELRDAFEDEGSKVKKGKLLLTMAVPAGQNYIDKGYDVPSLSRDLDFINILNYDYHSAYEPTINHHAALLPAPGTSEYEWNAQLNVDWTVNYYISLGAERQKLVIGIPTYGRSYTLLDGNFTDFGASADGPGEQGKYTKENGFMAFYEVCENIASNGWEVRKPYPRRIGPYAFSGDQWVGYDDEKIVARKAEYVREQDLGGIMFWSLDNDDFRGICNGEQYPLVEAGKKALFGADDTKSNEARRLEATPSTRGGASASDSQRSRDRFRTTTQEPEPQEPPVRTRQRTPATRTQDSTPATRTRTRGRFRTQDATTTTREPFRTAEGGSRDDAGQRVRGGTRFRDARPQTDTDRSTRIRVRPTRATTPARVPGRRRRPGGRPQNRRQQQATTIDPLNTPAPPTTPSPSTGFSCKREGFYPNPDNCHKYYWCLDSGASGLGIVAHSFTCPSDLVFNKVIDGCDHPDRAKFRPRRRADLTEPEAVEPVSNAVARKIHNSGGNQFVASDAPADEPAPSSGSPGSRSRPQYQSIARERPQAPPAAAAEEESPSAAPETRGDPLRQYTTIQRQRPPAQAAARAQEEAEAREAAGSAGGSAGGRRNYVTLERRRRPGAASEATEAPFESFEPTQPALEYVTIRRDRDRTPIPPSPSDTTLSPSSPLEEPQQTRVAQGPTTPRYVTLQRGRGTTPEPATTVEEEIPTTFEETTVASTFPVSAPPVKYRPLVVRPSSTPSGIATPTPILDIEENLLHEVAPPGPADQRPSLPLPADQQAAGVQPPLLPADHSPPPPPPPSPQATSESPEILAQRPAEDQRDLFDPSELTGSADPVRGRVSSRTRIAGVDHENNLVVKVVRGRKRVRVSAASSRTTVSPVSESVVVTPADLAPEVVSVQDYENAIAPEDSDAQHRRMPVSVPGFGAASGSHATRGSVTESLTTGSRDVGGIDVSLDISGSVPFGVRGANDAFVAPTGVRGTIVAGTAGVTGTTTSQSKGISVATDNLSSQSATDAHAFEANDIAASRGTVISHASTSSRGTAASHSIDASLGILGGSDPVYGTVTASRGAAASRGTVTSQDVAAFTGTIDADNAIVSQLQWHFASHSCQLTSRGTLASHELPAHVHCCFSVSRAQLSCQLTWHFASHDFSLLLLMRCQLTWHCASHELPAHVALAASQRVASSRGTVASLWHCCSRTALLLLKKLPAHVALLLLMKLPAHVALLLLLSAHVALLLLKKLPAHVALLLLMTLPAHVALLLLMTLPAHVALLLQRVACQLTSRGTVASQEVASSRGTVASHDVASSRALLLLMKLPAHVALLLLKRLPAHLTCTVASHEVASSRGTVALNVASSRGTVASQAHVLPAHVALLLLMTLPSRGTVASHDQLTWHCCFSCCSSRGTVASHDARGTVASHVPAHVHCVTLPAHVHCCFSCCQLTCMTAHVHSHVSRALCFSRVAAHVALLLLMLHVALRASSRGTVASHDVASSPHVALLLLMTLPAHVARTHVHCCFSLHVHSFSRCCHSRALLLLVASSRGTVASHDVASSRGTVASHDVASSRGTVASHDVASSRGTVASHDVASSRGTVASHDVASSRGTVASTTLPAQLLLLPAHVALLLLKRLPAHVALLRLMTSRGTVASQEVASSRGTVASNDVDISRGTVASHDVAISRGTVASHDVASSRGTVASHDVASSRGTVVSHDVASSRGTVASHDVASSRGTVASHDVASSRGTVVSHDVASSRGTLASHDVASSRGTVGSHGVSISSGTRGSIEASRGTFDVSTTVVDDTGAVRGDTRNTLTSRGSIATGVTTTGDSPITTSDTQTHVQLEHESSQAASFAAVQGSRIGLVGTQDDLVSTSGFIEHSDPQQSLDFVSSGDDPVLELTSRTGSDLAPAQSPISTLETAKKVSVSLTVHGTGHTLQHEGKLQLVHEGSIPDAVNEKSPLVHGSQHGVKSEGRMAVETAMEKAKVHANTNPQRGPAEEGRPRLHDALSPQTGDDFGAPNTNTRQRPPSNRLQQPPPGVVCRLWGAQDLHSPPPPAVLHIHHGRGSICHKSALG
ncbi:putative mucin-17-like [Penaeus vannamei]|uniref:chitinase n=1 Tax=Penaeus vannamei TaxID=6689 RepID=A0A3R7Q3S1_PENVA|nr:putative mucin-17-like [Penaeus vannamei]